MTAALDQNHTECARKTLVKLSQMRTQPVPENYCKEFSSISGYEPMCSKAGPETLQTLEDALDVVRVMAESIVTRYTSDETAVRLTENVSRLLAEKNLYEIRALVDGIIRHDRIREDGRQSSFAAFLGVAEANDTIIRRLEESVGRSRSALRSEAEALNLAASEQEMRSISRNIARQTDEIDLAMKSAMAEADLNAKALHQAQQQIANLEAKIQEYAEFVTHDPLTKVLNRRGFEEAWKREKAKTSQCGSPLAIAVVDVDNFKRLNDSLGHQTGDAALVYLADSITASLRQKDVVSRYGGEEFVILLPETDKADAVAILQALQRDLTKQLFMAEQSREILITFSAGVSAVMAEDTAAEAFRRADDAMYKAKLAGRNRVVSD